MSAMDVADHRFQLNVSKSFVMMTLYFFVVLLIAENLALLHYDLVVGDVVIAVHML